MEAEFPMELTMQMGRCVRLPVYATFVTHLSFVQADLSNSWRDARYDWARGVYAFDR